MRPDLPAVLHRKQTQWDVAAGTREIPCQPPADGREAVIVACRLPLDQPELRIGDALRISRI